MLPACIAQMAASGTPLRVEDLTAETVPPLSRQALAARGYTVDAPEVEEVEPPAPVETAPPPRVETGRGVDTSQEGIERMRAALSAYLDAKGMSEDSPNGRQYRRTFDRFAERVSGRAGGDLRRMFEEHLAMAGKGGIPASDAIIGRTVMNHLARALESQSRRA